MTEELSLKIKQIGFGNIFLIVCSLFYLLWWMLAFRPDRQASKMLCVMLLIAAFLTGLTGLFFTVRGISTQKTDVLRVPLSRIVLLGIISYVVLLLITYFLLKRQVTSELVLITGWAVLELCIVDVLLSNHIFSGGTAAISGGLIILAVILSLICYLVYYKLGPVKSYIDGTIPLLLDALVMCFITIRMYR